MLPGKKMHLLQRLISPQVFILILHLNLGIFHGNDIIIPHRIPAALAGKIVKWRMVFSRGVESFFYFIKPYRV